MDTKCRSNLIWTTYAICRNKSVQTEVKCYVFDDQGYRRDLTPLIKTRGSSYKVLSQDQDFYINVCSGLSNMCPEENTGACLKIGNNKYTKVGDFRFNTLEFKGSSALVPFEHLEMTYRSKAGDLCHSADLNFTSTTTIRFICPPKSHKRSIDYVDRNPKLVSNLDCNYQIEWLTEYACPRHSISSSAAECRFTDDIHGIDFNLKLLLKSGQNDFYKIENIDISVNKSFDMLFNVCGGLSKSIKCGDQKWDSMSVCLKSRNANFKDKAIGFTSTGTLNFVDNKVLLEYKSKDSDCKFGNNYIAETTLIEFICDPKVNEGKGNPEFVSYEECTYYIIWKTSLVCPVVNPKIACLTTYKNMTFDLSPLRKSYGSDPWTASQSALLPWSRYAKKKSDTIYLNVCGVVPKTMATDSCDSRSSVCMTSGDTKETTSLGRFLTPPTYNEDIGAIELIYYNEYDNKTKKSITSRLVFKCSHGSEESDPILVDVNQETGTYYFEWQTFAGCPINYSVGTNCTIHDTFLDYTFDLSSLKSETYWPIKTDDYEFQINVCTQVNSQSCTAANVKKAEGPYGACQLELKGEKRIFSLGKATSSLTYWNGVINMTLTEGTTYNDPAKTPRKAHIAFICDLNAGHNTGPEYDGEKDRSYFFRWYTPLACPHQTKTVHCIWENGTHILDLSNLAMSSGNHFAVSLTAGAETAPSIYFINVCRPLNPMHETKLDPKQCPPSSAACAIKLDANKSALSLGEATHPPFSGFDGSITLIYENGSPCPTNTNRTIKSRVKFECAPEAGLGSPIVHEPGSDQTDGEDCVYLFEWRTSAACDILQPTKSENTSCVFTDPLTKLSVDLSPLVRSRNSVYHKVDVNMNKSTFELNVCGLSKPFSSKQCSESAICYHSGSQSESDVSYGLLNSSSVFYSLHSDSLRLRYSNGSKCSAHKETTTMSSEIVFTCNPQAVNTQPRMHSTHACAAVFEWETDLVCALQPPDCSIVFNNKYYNLRQLSSMTHSWNTTDKDGNIYYLNICSKLPPSIPCNGLNAAACKCKPDSDAKLICSESLGEPSAHELQVLANGSLQLTYKSGSEELCENGLKAQTQIMFKCGKTTGSPKFVEFVKQKCIYRFSWESFMSCPVTDNNDNLIPENNGFLHDQRLGIYIDIGPLLDQTFKVKESRLNSANLTDHYVYVINLKSPQSDPTSECSKAAVCQTKDPILRRDIGSVDAIQYFLKGHELQIVLQSNGSRKECGRTPNKNVTTIIKLQCSSNTGIGGPVFMYESNDCDYTFIWETDLVCPQKFIDHQQYQEAISNKSKDVESAISTSSEDRKSSKSGSVWIGIVIVVFFVLTLAAIFTYKQRVR